MCWSAQISLLTACVHVITLGFVLRLDHKLTPFVRSGFLKFLGFYLIMELFQALQWLTANPQHFGPKQSCSSWNQGTTVLAYFLIWAQPYLFSSIAGNKSANSLNRASVITLAYAMFAILKPLVFKQTSCSIDYSNYHSNTCTFAGKHGHLDWKFAIVNIMYQPTHFVYLLLIGLTLPKLHDVHKWTIGVGWILTLLLSIYLVGGGPEVPAFWCMTSALIDIPILGYLGYKLIK